MISLLIILILLITSVTVFIFIKFYKLKRSIKNAPKSLKRICDAWSVFTIDENLYIRSIENINEDVVLYVPYEKLLNTNIKELPGLVSKNNLEAAKLITGGVLSTYDTREPLYFEYPLKDECNMTGFGLCFMEPSHDGGVIAHAMKIDMRRLVDSRKFFIDEALFNGMDKVAAGIYIKQFSGTAINDCKYAFFNDKAREFYGCDDIISSDNWDQSEEDDLDMKVISGDKSIQYEKVIYDDGLPLKYLSVNKKAVRDMDGYNYVITTLNDITGLKKTIRNKEEEEKRIGNIRKTLDMTMQSAHIAAWVYDVNSREYEMLYGDFRIGQAGNSDIISGLMHPDDKEKYRKYIYDIIRYKKPGKSLNVRIRNGDRYDYYETVINVISGNDGEVTHLIGSLINLQRVYSLKEEIEWQYRDMNSILKSLPVGIEVYDGDGNLFTINDRNCEIFGVDSDYIYELNLNIDRNFILNDEQRETLKRGDSLHFDFTFDFNSYISSNNYKSSYKDVVKRIECRATPILNLEGKIERYIFIFDDITERYRQAIALSQSELKTSLAIKSSGSAQWDFDCSDQTFTLYKYSSFEVDSVLTCDKFCSLVHPLDIQKVAKLINLMQSGVEQNYTFDLRLKNVEHTEWQYITMTCAPLEYDESGNIIKYTGLRHNSTKLIRLQKELEDINARLRLVLETGDIIPIEWDINKNVIYITSKRLKDKYTSIFDLSINGMPVDVIYDYIHPGDKENIKAIFQGFLKNEINSATGIVRFDKNKEFLKHFELNMTAQRNIKGDIIKVIGCMQDITRRREAEIQKEMNEKFLQSMLDNIPFPLQVIDIENDNKYVYWNKESENLFGNGLYKSPADILSYGEADDVLKSSINVYLTGESILEHEYIKTATGKSLETYVSKSIIYHGEKRLVLIVRWDISDMLELQRKSKLLSSSVDYLNGFTWSCDVDTGVFSYGAGLKKTGADPEALNTILKFAAMVHPDDRKEYIKFFDDFILRSRGEYSLTYRADLSGNNHYEWWESRGIVEVDPNTGRKYFYGMDINIQSHKIVEEQLSNALKKAKESDRLKSAFLANVSHEIRTPLNAIVGFSNLLMMTSEESEKEEYMKIISTNNELLLRLIGDILELSKIESNSMEFNEEEFELSLYLQAIGTMMRQRISRPDVRLVVDNPYESCKIKMDKDRLTQIITNFITNSIKYTDKGEIRIGYEAYGDGIKVYVKDTGIGIPDDKKDRVFQRFEKLDSFVQGTGLGLSICKALVEMYNGEIGFESKENEGSCFWASFPVPVSVGNQI